MRSYFTNDAWLIVEEGKQNLQVGFSIHAIMIYVRKLQLFVNHVYNGTTFSVRESRHSPKRSTGSVVHVLSSSYSVDYLTCSI